MYIVIFQHIIGLHARSLIITCQHIDRASELLGRYVANAPHTPERPTIYMHVCSAIICYNHRTMDGTGFPKRSDSTGSIYALAPQLKESSCIAQHICCSLLAALLPSRCWLLCVCICNMCAMLSIYLADYLTERMIDCMQVLVLPRPPSLLHP
jgi:hypothetical protein